MKRFSLATRLWIFVALAGFMGFAKSALDSLDGLTLSTYHGFLWQYWASFLCAVIGVGGVIWQIRKK
jgi:hypothetical protein